MSSEINSYVDGLTKTPLPRTRSSYKETRKQTPPVVHSTTTTNFAEKIVSHHHAAAYTRKKKVYTTIMAHTVTGTSESSSLPYHDLGSQIL